MFSQQAQPQFTIEDSECGRFWNDDGDDDRTHSDTFFILLEDSGKIQLETGTGFLLLEASP